MIGHLLVMHWHLPFWMQQLPRQWHLVFNPALSDGTPAGHAQLFACLNAAVAQAVTLILVQHWVRGHLLITHTRTCASCQSSSCRVVVWWCLWNTIGGNCHKYNFCHDKRVIVVTKHRSMLVVTNIILSRQKFCHDTNACLSWQNRSFKDTCSSSSQW